MRQPRFLLRLLALAAFTLALLYKPIPVSADVGPKPSMAFTFEFEGDPIPIVSAILYECDDDQCTNPESLKELGPQRLTCSETGCSAVAYGFADYHQLVIEFSDRTRASNIFSKKAFSASYTVTVTSDALEIKEKRKLFDPNCCLPGVFGTLLIETGIAALFLLAFHLPKNILGWIPLASLLTLPFVWGAFPFLPLPSGWVTGLSEVFATAAETAILYLLPGRILTLRQAALLSLATNTASFLAGVLPL
jgi:hypothetical protein